MVLSQFVGPSHERSNTHCLSSCTRRQLEDVSTVEQHGQQMRTALFWIITQPVVAISYRRFGTTYRSDPQCSATTRRIITQKSAVLNYVASEA